MRAPVTASERDPRPLLGIVADDRGDPPAEGLAWSLLADLTDLIRCDAIAFFGLDSDRRASRFGQDLPADDADDEQVFWEHYRDCDSCSYPDRSGDVRSVTKLSDFYSARQWHATGMYSDHDRSRGIEHELLLCLPDAGRTAGPGQAAGPGRTVRLMLTRGRGPDFSERDRALLALLRPHLQHAYLDAERRRHPTPELTTRQRELMYLVAAGHTNTQIARLLGLSEGTVRTHLANIYGRLQVSSRTAAVTRGFPDWPAL
jgi:DNA-binding CsgD family transcriptional regulator